MQLCADAQLGVVQKFLMFPGQVIEKSYGPNFTDAFTMTSLRCHYTDVTCFDAAFRETLLVARPHRPK